MRAHLKQPLKIIFLTVLGAAFLPGPVSAQVEIRPTSNAAAPSLALPLPVSTPAPSVDLGAVPTSLPTSAQGASMAPPPGAVAATPSIIASQSAVPASGSSLTSMPTMTLNTIAPVNIPLMATPRLPTKTLVRTVAHPPNRTARAAHAQADAGAIDDNAAGGSVERLAYRQLPVRVTLRAGRERILRFSHPVTLSVPEELNASVKQLDIIERAIYITASGAFPRTRVIVHDLVTGQLLPLDLQATATASVSDVVEISAPGDTEEAAPGSAGSLVAHRRGGAGDDDDDNGPATPVDMVTLTRFAAINLYAPQRLVTPVAGVRQVAVASRPLKNLYRGETIEATPIGAWRSQDLYVTAVKLVNRSHTPVNLDMTQFRGQWLAATPQHGTLAAAGDERDTTAVYLVSQRAFDEVR